MLWENCFVGLFWYIINCMGPLWYYRVLVATVVLLQSLAAVITNNGQGAKTAACGQINVLMVRLKISYHHLVSLFWCQLLLYSVKISQRLINRRPGGMGSDERLLTHKMPRLCPDFCPGAPHSHIHTRPGIEAAAARARVRASICITFGGIWPDTHDPHGAWITFLRNIKLWPVLGICLLDCQISSRLETWKSGVKPDNALL